MKLVNRLLRGAVAAALLLAALPGWANDCFVKPNNVANGNGSSWSSPMPLVNALVDASCTIVYVAGGVYKPGPAGHSEYSFVVRNGTRMYGGFFGVPGTELDMAQRDPMRTPSVLSGDIDDNDVVDGHGVTRNWLLDNRGSNTLRLVNVQAGSTTADTVLDGLVITGGSNLHGNPYQPFEAGGLTCLAAGAGNQCRLTLSNVWFSGNVGNVMGALQIDAYDHGAASLTLANVTFSGNTGAMLLRNRSLLKNGDGTPIYPDPGVIQTRIANNTFAENAFPIGWPGIEFEADNIDVVNSTFYKTPIRNDGTQQQLMLRNTLVWGADDVAGGVVGDFSGNHNIFGSTCDGIGCTSPNDPRLASLQDNGGFTLTMLPGSGSSLIDAGDDSVCATNNVDQRGVARPQGAHCDIGAVEAHLAALNVGVTGGGSVSASAAIAQYGSIVNCTSAGGVACSATYAGEPAVVTLKATVPAGQVVTWGGACHSSSTTATATLSGNPTTCTATFSVPTVWTVQTANEAASLTSNDCSLVAPGPGGVCSTLRDAMNRALNGDIIRFAPALDGATIALTLFGNDLGCTTDGPTQCAPGNPAGSHLTTQFGPSAFFISSKGVTIDAVTGLAQGVTIARDTDPTHYPGSLVAAPAFRLFDIDGSGGLNLYGATLRNGVAHGGSSNVNGGGALGAGGAIFSQGGLTIDRCTFADNAALGGDSSGSSLGSAGAGVGQDAPGITVTDWYPPGGGPNGGAFDSTNGYQRNGGFGGGGAMTFAPSGLSKGGNGGFGGGGGVGQANTASDSGFGGDGGFGGGAGGGLGTNANAGIGAPGFGGGGYALAPSGGGAGAGMGGAIFNDAGRLVATNSTFAGNTATGGGNDPRSAAGYGGAVFNYAGSAEFGFVTLHGNRVAAALFGGAIPSRAQAEGGAVYSLADSLAGCSAGGNPCASGDAKLIFNNSIAAGSTRLNNTDASIAATSDIVVNAINGGNSSSSGAGNIVMANTGFAGMVASSADPQLAPLPPGGGLVGVMVPVASSPVINAAANCGGANGVDQSGLARPQGAQCDIGAAELELALAFVGAPADIGPGDRLGPLQVQLQDTAGNPVTGDFSTEVTLSTQACGGSVVLGRATVSAGVATFEGDMGTVFYSLGAHSLTASATNLADASAQFNVVDAGGDFVFADGFEDCRM